MRKAFLKIKFAAIALPLILLLCTGCGDGPGEREYQNALRHLERGNQEQARDLFEKSINKRPGRGINAYAYHHLGVLAWQMGEIESATTYFESSRRLNPQLFEPVYSLAVLAWENHDLIRARSLFGSAAQLRPTDPRPMEYLAQTYPRDTGFAERRRMLMEALARAPQSPRILTSLAALELQHPQPNRERGMDWLMQALESNPAYAPALFNLGMIFFQEPDRHEDALEYFRQYIAVADSEAARQRAAPFMAQLRGEEPPTAVAVVTPTVEPEPPPAVTPPPPRTLAQQLDEADSIAATGDLQGAVALCLRIAARARQQQPALEETALRKAVQVGPQSATAHLALARYLAANAREAEAVASYRQTTQRQPDWIHAWVELAETALLLDQYDEALNAVQRAVERDSQAPDARWMLAIVLEETGSQRRAAEEFRAFHQRFPQDPRAGQALQRADFLQPPAPPQPSPVELALQSLQRGVALQQQGDRRGAMEHYRQAIAQNPDLESAHYNLGLILLEQGQAQGAVASFQRSVALAPDKPAARYNLALAQYQSARMDESKNQLDRVITLDPAFAPAHLLLGIIYAAEPADTLRARHHYRQFLNLTPNDPSAPAVREWLSQN
jgi:tetratricopeptide (TPR) repeat protein